VGDGNVEIDEPLVRSLLHEQHPDLAELDLRLAATGWSNEPWRFGVVAARPAHACPCLCRPKLGLGTGPPRQPADVGTRRPGGA
jgi:hypothetical protein